MSDRKCPDGGVCHHRCDESDYPLTCWRVATCGPLSNVFPNDEWPPEIVAAHGGLPPTDAELIADVMKHTRPVEPGRFVD